MSKEIKKPKHELKRFKFPIDLIEFPIKYSKDVITKKDDKDNKTLEMHLEGRYGPYHIETPRIYKIMDIRSRQITPCCHYTIILS